ncbi:transposase, partial [[Clostridium] innocuum]|nr:transposase [[Clostridium] innocuum]
NLEERTAEAEKLGLEKGLKKGLEKGLVKGKRTMLKALLIHKYEIDDNWVNSLSDQQIDDAVILILKCDTYDDLKEKLKKNELK